MYKNYYCWRKIGFMEIGRKRFPYTREQRHLIELDEKTEIIYKNQELFNYEIKNINKKIIFITFLIILLMALILLLLQK